VSERVEITRLGHAGHGVTADGLYVPYTVPGDVVQVERNGERARLLEIERAGPARGNAVCGHFMRCGGCALQHMEAASYLAWKEDLVRTALAQRGFADAPIDPIRAVAPGTRRRAAFKARKAGTDMLLGFYEPDSHRLVDISECPVLLPELAQRLPAMRALLGGLLTSGETAELHATVASNGVDLSLKWKRPRTPDLLMDLGAFARELDLARLTWNGEPVSIAREPVLRIGRFAVALPPEAFLQPTREGEAILQALVQEHVGSAATVADLFCGVGTFALALADTRNVHATDMGEAMLVALGEAAKHGKAKLTVEHRDLFRRPLLAAELARFQAAVIDPPRPGAKAQAEQLAASAVPKLVYVSCNPASFARDARILTNGGYRLTRITPVDQFLWSPHVELVAGFQRGAP
jgi:23S rRNA (uracil1939-C5)-methyltransferase